MHHLENHIKTSNCDKISGQLGQTNKLANGRYQTYYLPCFAVDNKHKSVVEDCAVCMMLLSVDEFMVVLLDSGKSEVVFTSVGVLINLMADEEKRPMLKKSDGIRG